MSHKEDVAPVKEGDYQLPKDELLKDVPMLAKGVVGGLIDAINKLDMNHDGKRDIVQAAPFVIALIPVAMAAGPLLHPEKLVDWVVSQPFVKDPAALRSVIEKALEIAAKAAIEVAPKA